MLTPRPKIAKAIRVSIRVPLHEHEWERLHELREETGLPIGRLVADAVRAVHLGKPA